VDDMWLTCYLTCGLHVNLTCGRHVVNMWFTCCLHAHIFFMRHIWITCYFDVIFRCDPNVAHVINMLHSHVNIPVLAHNM
jgi:hypothetical protein